jgi:hypothetical protein
MVLNPSFFSPFSSRWKFWIFSTPLHPPSRGIAGSYERGMPPTPKPEGPRNKVVLKLTFILGSVIFEII